VIKVCYYDTVVLVVTGVCSCCICCCCQPIRTPRRVRSGTQHKTWAQTGNDSSSVNLSFSDFFLYSRFCDIAPHVGIVFISFG